MPGTNEPKSPSTSVERSARTGVQGADGREQPSRFQRVMALFREAVGLAGEERLRLLDERAAGDASLRAEVEAMLGRDARAHATGPDVHALRAIQTGAGLAMAEHTPGGVEGGGLAQAESDVEMPRLAGHYRIVRLIGEGGMGVVYEAEQTLPRRVVALKAIRSGLIGRQVLRRFVREAHILGRLAHPGIAQIYEAGIVEDGTPANAEQAYLVMEYVDGLPLTEYASDLNVSIPDRLELMARVCDAVQHAHQRRVIHRDLKPANILVDAMGQPKVLDFGVAALATDGSGQTDRDGSMETLGLHLVGTLAYMAPEQLAPGSEAPDTRSDVYSLGVVLHQVMSGELPLAVKGLSLMDAARVIQTDVPPRLGTKDRRFRGDIETIAAKALEKDKDRRYQSVRELAEDLRRCAAGQPIAARSASLGYVLRKTARRHWVAVLAASGAIAAVAGLGVYAGIAAVRNERLAHELAEQLGDSQIERARLLSRTEQASAAEDALWGEIAKRPDSTLARWALWDLYSRSPCLATLPSREASAFDVSFSPDGTQISVANRLAGKVEIWDSSFTHPIHTFDVGTKKVLAATFTRDGRRIVTGDYEGRLKIWNVADGAMIVNRDAHKEGIGRIAISPDGLLIATAGRDEHVRLWGAVSGDPVHDLTGHAASVEGLAFSPDSQTLVTGAEDQSIRIWNVGTGECIKVLRPPEGAAKTGTSALAFSPDGKTMYSGGLDRSLRVWDVESWKVTSSTYEVPGYPYAIVPAPDGKTIYFANDAVEVRDATDGHLLRTITQPDGTRRALALSPDGRRLVTASMRGRVSLLETSPGAGRTSFETDSPFYCELAFSPDGRTLAGPGKGTSVVLRKVGRWDEHADLLGHTSSPLATAFSPDGGFLATGSFGGEVFLWDLAAGATIARIKTESGRGVIALRMSPDGRSLLVITADPRVIVYSIPGLVPANELDLSPLGKISGRILSAAWSPDSQIVSLGTAAEVLGIWRISQGPTAGLNKPERTVAIHDAQSSLVFSLDGKKLIAGLDKSIAVIDAATGQVDRRLLGHTQPTDGLVFADDRTLVSASRDRTIRLWNWPGGVPLATLELGSRQPASLAASPNGRWAACMVERSGVVVWDLSYYNRHVAGNAEWNLGRLLEGPPTEKTRRLFNDLRGRVPPADDRPPGR